MGYFVVSLDGDEILAEHRFEGALIKQYRSDRADRIAHAVAADMAISLPSHALWLGRELANKEHASTCTSNRSAARSCSPACVRRA